MSRRGSQRSGRRSLGFNGLRAWARRHAYSLLSSLGGMLRQPLASIMTIVVLAVTLSLPAGLYVALDNAARASDGWERLDSISVFLTAELGQGDALELAALLGTWPGVDAVQAISPETGLAELGGRLQLGEVVGELADNPLPWVLEVLPTGSQEPQLLAERLAGVKGVDQVLIDLQWLERLQAILDLLAQLAGLLALLFALAVAFVIGNTIRMEIQNRQEEIRVLALVGATDGFVRRPFLYSGLWFGLAGGLLAWLLVQLGLLVLSRPIARLSDSYASEFVLRSLPGSLMALLILGSGLLGVAGAWLAVNRHLRRIHPA